jgi:hypothetical protein
MKMNNTNPNTENKVCFMCPMLSVSCAQCCLFLVPNVVCFLCPMLSVSCVQCCLFLVPNVVCFLTRGEQKRQKQHWTQETDNIEHKTQKTLGTRHRQHWAQETDNIMLSVSCVQYCLFHVPNVVCFLCPMLSVSCAQCCLFIVPIVVCFLCPMLSV